MQNDRAPGEDRRPPDGGAAHLVVARREDVAGAVRSVRAGIEEACRRAGRDPGEVTLVAATKTVPLRVARWAWEAGVEHFGENYARELGAKAPVLPVTWHFLGKLQRGTAARIAECAHVVQSGEPGTGLQRLASRAHRDGKTIRCLAQVDFTGRRQGVESEDLAGFLRAARDLPGVAWIGLMTLPPWTGDPQGSRPYFARLWDLRERLRRHFPEILELSMGMSGDFQVAVEEGATMVRVGTALFGERPRGAAPEEP
jgi:pyridoxal phosphate enzyme (YggS family)